jgi:hypothetical protein
VIANMRVERADGLAGQSSQVRYGIDSKISILTYDRPYNSCRTFNL